MKLLSVNHGKYVFLASAGEKETWCGLLRLYPLQSDVVQPKGQKNAADAALLKEALQAERQLLRREIDSLLQGDGGFVAHKGGFKLSLKPAQVEVLLQILNDLRVGSWHALGAPEAPYQLRFDGNDSRLRHLWIMEIAGRFQMLLLEATAATEV